LVAGGWVAGGWAGGVCVAGACANAVPAESATARAVVAIISFNGFIKTIPSFNSNDLRKANTFMVVKRRSHAALQPR
jgi:hypothetical protein